MTDPVSGSNQSDPQNAPVATPEQLAAARERRGLGKGEVAQRLKLHPRQLEALERGDWAALPGRAFVRGCVRSYGRLLGVDVAPLLDSIGGFAEPEELKSSAPLAAPLPRGGGFGFDIEGHRSKLPWAVLGVIGVIAVGLFFGRDGDVSRVSSWIGQGERASEAPAGSAPAPAASQSGAAVPGAGVPPGTPLVPPPLVPAPSGTTGAATPPAAPEPPAPPAAAPPPPPPPPPPIRVSVRQDAWVDVRQADGKSVFMGTVKPGTPLEVKGQAPYTLTIGNASAVTLEYEGTVVDLKGSTVMPNNIAKVKLP